MNNKCERKMGQNKDSYTIRTDRCAMVNLRGDN